MQHRVAAAPPQQEEDAHYEDCSENAKGAEQPEYSLYYGVVDEKIVGMIRLIGKQAGPFWGTLQQIGVPKKVRAIPN